MQIVISDRAQARTEDLDSMFRLRHDVFKTRLNWEVPVVDGREVDQFDEMNPIYMMVRDDGNTVCGCWRLLPTTGPYMLKDIFPELLHGQEAPCDSEVWEISRFATGRHRTASGGFSAMPIRMIQEVVAFAEKRNIRQYVAVTTVAFERMLRSLGVDIRRFGSPLQVGIEKTVAFTLEINEKTHRALFNTERVAANDAVYAKAA